MLDLIFTLPFLQPPLCTVQQGMSDFPTPVAEYKNKPKQVIVPTEPFYVTNSF